MSIRHNEAIAMYEKGANFAPAFGMCATVISLVNMLGGLDFTDPEAVNKLGGNMSAALITTLYGSMLANIVFVPLAGRLKVLHKREVFNKTLICTGLLAIMNGSSAKFIREFLYEQLSKENKKNANKTGGGAQ